MTTTTNGEKDEDRILKTYQGLLGEIGCKFLKEEKESLDYYTVVLPSLLWPIIDEKLLQGIYGT